MNVQPTAPSPPRSRRYPRSPRGYLENAASLESDREHSETDESAVRQRRRKSSHSRERNFRSKLAQQVAQSARCSLPKQIVFVRHGESQGNADHSLYRTMPDNLVELTEKGWEQAMEAGRRIKSIIGDKHVHMYTSPFVRTVQTSAAIRQSLGDQVVRMNVDPRIREQEFGNLQGDQFKEYREEQQQVGRFYYRFPTGESGADVWDRTKQWWDSLMSINLLLPKRADVVVVVTHGLTMRLILMQMYGWTPNTFHSVWNANNCDLYVFETERDSMYDSDLTRLPYRLNPELGDSPTSSIKLEVEIEGESVPRKLELKNYLDIPRPRLQQLPLVQFFLREQHPTLAEKNIVSVRCTGNFYGEFCSTSFTVSEESWKKEKREHKKAGRSSMWTLDTSANYVDTGHEGYLSSPDPIGRGLTS